MSEQTAARIEKIARRRAKAKLGWFIHATVYLAVNLCLIGLSLAAGRNWAVYPLLGWGIGLAAHGASVWLLPYGSGMLDRMAARERERLAVTASPPPSGDPW